MAEETPTTIPTFTMTPELEAVLARGRQMHPTFSDDVRMADDMFGILTEKYTESMKLPELDDKRGILRYAGLNDDMIGWALEKYRADFPSDPEQLAIPFSTMDRGTVIKCYDFPLLGRFDKILMKRDTKAIYELDESYDDYARGGLAEGLRPEFAIFCGLHPSEPDYDDEWYRKHFYVQCYQEHADNIMRKWLASLSLLWDQKLKLEEVDRQTEVPSTEAELDAQERHNTDHRSQAQLNNGKGDGNEDGNEAADE